MTQVEINTKVIKAIENLTGDFLSAIHDEAKGYAFKTIKGWRVISYEYANEIAGLGYINQCLID